MRIRECEIGGVEARLARVSFTGELQYEISVPARYGASLMEVLLEAKPAPRVVGLEAWLRLRLEKGYLHIGSDTNGRTTPLDVGMAHVVGRREDDFIGKRSLSLPFARSPEREQLVGLVALEGALEVGGRVLGAGHGGPPCPTQGYVTSACYSPSLRRSIGLGLVERGFAREGEIVSIYSRGRVTRARIGRTAVYDPANERLAS
jgi:sarcosine oxidase subunit alpha